MSTRTEQAIIEIQKVMKYHGVDGAAFISDGVDGKATVFFRDSLLMEPHLLENEALTLNVKALRGDYPELSNKIGESGKVLHLFANAFRDMNAVFQNALSRLITEHQQLALQELKRIKHSLK